LKKIYCSFGGSAYDATLRHIVEDAPGFGIDEIRIYDDRWLTTTDFFKLNRWIFDLRSRQEHRGFGWYCWKPYLILLEMERAQPGDIVLWSDGDCFPIADLKFLFDRCRTDDGIMLFAAEGWTQGQSTKRSCMRAMACDTYDYRHAQHATARFALFEAGNWRAKQFLMEWLAYCLNPACVGLEPGADEYPEYREHRSDQSILTNLAHRYGLNLYREADEFGDGTQRDRDLYGTLFRQIYRSGIDSLNGSKWRNV
jgi:hypothetical protein